MSLFAKPFVFKNRNNILDRDPDSTAYRHALSCVLTASLSLQVAVVKVTTVCEHRASPDKEEGRARGHLTSFCYSISLSAVPREAKPTDPGGHIGGSGAPSQLCQVA